MLGYRLRVPKLSPRSCGAAAAAAAAAAKEDPYHINPWSRAGHPGHAGYPGQDDVEFKLLILKPFVEAAAAAFVVEIGGFKKALFEAGKCYGGQRGIGYDTDASRELENEICKHMTVK